MSGVFSCWGTSVFQHGPYSFISQEPKVITFFFLSQLIATSQTLVSLCIRFGAEAHPGFVMNSITMLSVHPLLVHLFGETQIVG